MIWNCKYGIICNYPKDKVLYLINLNTCTFKLYDKANRESHKRHNLAKDKLAMAFMWLIHSDMKWNIKTCTHGIHRI